MTQEQSTVTWEHYLAKEEISFENSAVYQILLFEAKYWFQIRSSNAMKKVIPPWHGILVDMSLGLDPCYSGHHIGGGKWHRKTQGAALPLEDPL